jgi:ElaA protein
MRYTARMDPITWRWYHWNQLSQNDLYQLLQLRQQVFIVEQRCIFNDADGVDPYCRHLIAWQNKQAVAALRLVPVLVKYPAVSIGRVVNAASVRGMGVGRELMRRALECVDHAGTPVTTISAQSYLQRFYTEFGYECIDQPYLEDGIEHLQMHRLLPQRQAAALKYNQSVRLVYAPLTANDADELFVALRDPIIYQHMEEKPYADVEQLRVRYARLEIGAPEGAGQIWLNWVVRTASDRQAIGTVQATLYPNAQCDIGYAFDIRHWGQGYGTEAIEWLCKTLSTRYGMQSVNAQVDQANPSSIRVLQKCGFQLIATGQNSEGEAELQYQLLV